MAAVLARYLLIAVVSLGLGIAANNLIWRNGTGWEGFLNAEIYFLLTEYAIFHAIALSVAAILSGIFSMRARFILYFAISVTGFSASLYLLRPTTYGGIHFFIICWGSLVLIAADYAWRSSRQRDQHQTPSPS